MNCDKPWAPAGETAAGFQPDSCSICAAISGGLTSAHIEPASMTHASNSGGTVPVANEPWLKSDDGEVSSSSTAIMMIGARMSARTAATRVPVDFMS